MTLSHLLFQQLPVLLLIFIRLTSFFLIAPFYSFKGLPTRLKIGFGFAISVITLPMIELNRAITFNGEYFLLLMKEISIGILLGFIAAFIIYTVQVCGAFIDFQMGFAIANVVDPQTGIQVPIISQFKYILSILFLLSIDGHHLFIDGVMKSFQIISIDQYISLGNESFALFMLSIFAKMFLTAAQIALPIVGALFLVDVGLGIIARTVPQMNVFVIGMPLKIFVGFILLLLTLPIFFVLLQHILWNVTENMGELLKVIGV